MFFLLLPQLHNSTKVLKAFEKNYLVCFRSDLRSYQTNNKISRKYFLETCGIVELWIGIFCEIKISFCVFAYFYFFEFLIWQINATNYTTTTIGLGGEIFSKSSLVLFIILVMISLASKGMVYEVFWRLVQISVAFSITFDTIDPCPRTHCALFTYSNELC
jgi:hypothetical protein